MKLSEPFDVDILIANMTEASVNQRVDPGLAGRAPATMTWDEAKRAELLGIAENMRDYANFGEAGRVCSDAIREALEFPVEEWETAYNGENEPPARNLSARERDILTRVLGSLVRPYFANNAEDKYYIEARSAFAKYTSIDQDVQTLHIIRQVLEPRAE